MPSSNIAFIYLVDDSTIAVACSTEKCDELNKQFQLVGTLPCPTSLHEEVYNKIQFIGVMKGYLAGRVDTLAEVSQLIPLDNAGRDVLGELSHDLRYHLNVLGMLSNLTTSHLKQFATLNRTEGNIGEKVRILQDIIDAEKYPPVGNPVIIVPSPK